MTFLDPERKFRVLPESLDLNKCISLGWHFDQEVLEGSTSTSTSTSYQAEFVGKNMQVSGHNTLVVLDSDKHLPLIRAYYLAKYKMKTSPDKPLVSLTKFKLKTFNNDLSLLRQRLSQQAAFDLSNWLDLWWRHVPVDYIRRRWESCPPSFLVVQVEASNHDLYFWRTGMLRASAQWHLTLVQSKVHMSVTPVAAFEQESKGIKKSPTRKWEEKHVPSDQIDAGELVSRVQLRPPIMTALQFQNLQQFGLLCFSNVGVMQDPSHPDFHHLILDYTHKLLGLPENIDLNNYEQAPVLNSPFAQKKLGVQDEQVQRKAGKPRSTHFPKICSSSGYGHCSQAVEAVTRVCMPYMSAVHGFPCKKRVSEYSLQVPRAEERFFVASTLPNVMDLDLHLEGVLDLEAQEEKGVSCDQLKRKRYPSEDDHLPPSSTVGLLVHPNPYLCSHAWMSSVHEWQDWMDQVQFYDLEEFPDPTTFRAPSPK